MEFNFETLKDFVKKELEKDKSGHDTEHTFRVLNNAKRILKEFPLADKEIVTASCLLHDIAIPSKGSKQHNITGSEMAEQILKEFKFPKEKIAGVKESILFHCPHGDKSHSKIPEERTIEENILIDSDNLDALGAIGIKRMVDFCTSHNIPFFKSKEDKFDESFYGSLKKITEWQEDLFTEEAKKIGKQRIKIMQDFLVQIEKEYEQQI